MSSATPADAEDRTGRARIRDAAIACVAAQGIAGMSVRAVAESAGVSPALVIHHFGSRDGLLAACDDHVATLIREQKRAAVGGGLDPLASLRAYDEGPPLIGYLARALVEGSAHTVALVDEMVADAVDYLAEAEQAGLVRPSDDPQARAALLVLWSLGAVALHEQVERHLGADLTGTSEQMRPYMLAASEVLVDGVLEPEVGHRLRDELVATGPDGAGRADDVAAGHGDAAGTTQEAEA